MEIDTKARAEAAFYGSGYWKNFFSTDPTDPKIGVTEESGMWKIEIDSVNYSTTLMLARSGKIVSAKTTVTDKYGQEREFSGIPTAEIVLGQVPVF